MEKWLIWLVFLLVADINWFLFSGEKLMKKPGQHFWHYDYQTYICPEAVFERANDWLPDFEIKTGGGSFWRQLDWSLPWDHHKHHWYSTMIDCSTVRSKQVAAAWLISPLSCGGSNTHTSRESWNILRCKYLICSSLHTHYISNFEGSNHVQSLHLQISYFLLESLKQMQTVILLGFCCNGGDFSFWESQL